MTHLERNRNIPITIVCLFASDHLLLSYSFSLALSFFFLSSLRFKVLIVFEFFWLSVGSFDYAEKRTNEQGTEQMGEFVQRRGSRRKDLGLLGNLLLDETTKIFETAI